MKRVLGVFLVLIIGVVITMFIKPQKKLPVFNPCNVYPALVDSVIQDQCVGHKISKFKLINQQGDSVNEQLIENKIALVDFFFVSCLSICPKMNAQLKRIHDEFLYEDLVILLSHTVWPEVDSVEVLKEYADLYGADSRKWHFLTGDKKELYRMARQSYLVVPSVYDSTFTHGDSSDFIHTENVVLIDQKKQIRGYYDGTNPTEIDVLIEDIKLLLDEN